MLFFSTLQINGTPNNQPAGFTKIFAEKLESIFALNDDPSFDQDVKTAIDHASPFFFSRAPKIDQIVPTNNIEVRDIKKLRTRGSPGPDQITNKVLKSLPPIFNEIFTRLANSSMTLSHIPDFWKNATVVMIPKPFKNHSNPSLLKITRKDYSAKTKQMDG